MKRTILWSLVCAIALSLGPAGAMDAAAGDDDVAELQAAFERYTGVPLVFRRADLPPDHYYDRMPVLSDVERANAARLLLDEARKYPQGYLGAMGLAAIGVFDALISDTGDGYRPYNEELGGYRYYGQWNGSDAIIAAYYTDGQLPLTFHHEVFHHIDATRGGTTSYAKNFASDDEAFAAAVAGDAPYPAIRLEAADRALLEARAEGVTLDGAVSDYTAKSHGEDQAETARHFMTALADSLLQAADHPELAGSQRILHILAQYEVAIDGGPGVSWFVDVAVGRDLAAADATARFAAAVTDGYQAMRDRIEPDGDDRFVIHGGEDADGVNWTLRADLAGFASEAAQLHALAGAAGDVDTDLARAQLRRLRLLARYREYIAARWSISAGTGRAFESARDAMLAALPDRAHWAIDVLGARTFAELTAGITAEGQVYGWLIEEPAPAPAPDNEYLSKVDDAIDDPTVRAAIRAVQPAAVRLDNGSGVNIHPSGVVLTAAHVSKELGAVKTVTFPDGTSYRGVTTAIDHHLDLAIVTLEGASSVPVAPLAEAAPEVGTTVVAIGQPGRWTPDGEPTGYQPWHVSVGEIRRFADDRLADQGLGGTAHDAWTYWGHSGCPLFDATGHVVALHNSWDSTTAMRHAVTWEAIVQFLSEVTD